MTLAADNQAVCSSPPHPSLPRQGFSFKLSHKLWLIVWVGVPVCKCLLLLGSKFKASGPQAQEETLFCKHPAPKTTGPCVRASAHLCRTKKRNRKGTWVWWLTGIISHCPRSTANPIRFWLHPKISKRNYTVFTHPYLPCGEMRMDTLINVQNDIQLKQAQYILQGLAQGSFQRPLLEQFRPVSLTHVYLVGKVYLPATEAASWSFRNRKTDTLAGAHRRQRFLTELDMPPCTFKSQSADAFNMRRGSCFPDAFPPTPREDVFRKRLVAMEALLSPTSVLGWKTFNQSPDLLSIPKFIKIRIRRRQTRWFQKTKWFFAHKWTTRLSNQTLHNHGWLSHTFIPKLLLQTAAFEENNTGSQISRITGGLCHCYVLNIKWMLWNSIQSGC